MGKQIAINSWTNYFSRDAFVVPGGESSANETLLGPPVVPFSPFWGEGSPTSLDYRKKLVHLF